MRTGYWHGSDAVILSGNRNDGYTILVGGGYSDAEIRRVKRLLREGNPLGEYEDYIVFTDADEWNEQQ